MIYKNTKQAIFIERPNRFIARVYVDGEVKTVHVKNTGRCREILIPETKVILEKASNPDRKTEYSLIAAYKGNTLINIDSQVPNAVAAEALKAGLIGEIQGELNIKREVVFGASRFDIYYETGTEKGFIEVKGVTLENQGIAMFPDAPTERGRKHIYEMTKAVELGFKGYILFLIQMKGVKYFTPNRLTDEPLAEALKYASANCVNIIAYDSYISQDEITIGDKVEVRL